MTLHAIPLAAGRMRGCHVRCGEAMSTIEKAAAKLVAKRATKKQQEEPATPQQPAVAQGLSEQPQGLSEQPIERAGQSPVAAVAPRNLTHTCALDFPWLAENGFLVPGHDNRQQALEFRRIKRPLLLNTQKVASERNKIPSNLIFVTSALPSEGKTFVSLNLALSLAAEVDRTVLLIDGDVAKGDLSKWMGIHEETGLADMLVERKKDAQEMVFGTNVNRLEVLPCGRLIDNLDELFASELMDDVIEDLTKKFPNRILVVDGPPLLATTEAAVLAHQMGQVVLVVEANKTPQAAVKQAAAQIETCQNVSVLLNKAHRSESSGYGYGYGYGYGQQRGGIPESATPNPLKKPARPDTDVGLKSEVPLGNTTGIPGGKQTDTPLTNKADTPLDKKTGAKVGIKSEGSAEGADLVDANSKGKPKSGLGNEPTAKLDLGS